MALAPQKCHLENAIYFRENELVNKKEGESLSKDEWGKNK